MREIKFRGKRVDNGEWVYGWYVNRGGKHQIVTNEHLFPFQVHPETIGQYTGLKDRDGKEIYEGDILREVPKNEWEEHNYSCFEVFFHDGDANSDYNIGFSISRTHNHGAVCGGYIPSFKPKIVKTMNVIGNIHDNPELINT